jgi:vacuolar-type H+-ATPase subunit C/Vma6
MLTQALTEARSPAVRMTIRFLVDLRNLLAVLRFWRWRVTVAPALLAGGEIEPEALARAWTGRDAGLLRHLAGRLGKVGLPDLEPRAAERELLGILTLRLRNAGRAPLGVGVVIDYLWRCQVASRNRALYQASGEAGVPAAMLA